MYELRKLKNEARKSILEERSNITPEEKAAYDEKITKYFLSSISYRYAGAKLIYVSTTEEISTDAIISSALESGKIVACPISCPETNTMSFKIIKSKDDLVNGAFDILEPGEHCVDYNEYMKANHPDKVHFAICVVPALAFDSKGTRIGYGKGFYDRFLSTFPGIKIGFCYSKFQTGELPSGKYDIKLDVGMTEKGVVAFK